MDKFQLRSSVVYKKTIYNKGDEDTMPKELVESMTKKYQATDALKAPVKTLAPKVPVKKPAAKTGEK